MVVEIGSGSRYYPAAGISADKAKADDLRNKLKNRRATDEELMEACRSFESYMLEQVMKEMKKSVSSEEDKNPYIEQFGDILYEEYARMASKSQGLGIAQMLYEAMKRQS